MANQKCAAGTEASRDTLQAAIDKALGFPRKGVHIGGGRHCEMPDTWDGTGETPPGWSKHAVPVWVVNASTAFVPIPDALASELQAAPAQARLTGAERSALATAISGRATVDPEAQGAIPKARAAIAAGRAEDAK